MDQQLLRTLLEPGGRAEDLAIDLERDREYGLARAGSSSSLARVLEEVFGLLVVHAPFLRLNGNGPRHSTSREFEEAYLDQRN